MTTFPTSTPLLWTSWQDPTPEQQFEFAKAVVPHVKWLHRDIVAGIARDNDDPAQGWHDFLAQLPKLPVSDYLWPGSPCVFPGIRRSTGERPNKTKSLLFDDCLRTDPTNNHYPNEIWRRVMQSPKPDKPRGKIEMNEKPAKFHLAHLIHHKDFNLDDGPTLETAEQEIEGVGWLRGAARPSSDNAFAGLFTSAANLCFMPAELMKPTDIQGALLHLLLQRAVLLYGDVCTLFPHGLKFQAPNPLGWQHDAKEDNGQCVFQWDSRQYGDPALTTYLNQWRRTELEEVLRIKLEPSAIKRTPRFASYYASTPAAPPLDVLC